MPDIFQESGHLEYFIRGLGCENDVSLDRCVRHLSVMHCVDVLDWPTVLWECVAGDSDCVTYCGKLDVGYVIGHASRHRRRRLHDLDCEIYDGHQLPDVDH